ncbi:MAG: DUF2239 family protein [Deltaproteobacteria bacterium]
MNQTFTAFAGTQRIASGPVESMVRRAKAVLDRGESRTLLIFDDRTGRQIDFDFSGTEEEVVAKLDRHPGLERPEAPPRRGPGRPKLGVVSREVSLLPRHWDWLSNQPGGMSGALRRLVDEARKKDAAPERLRKARDAASRFMWTMAGNLENFEEASRALYRDDLEGLNALIAGWPEDIRAHVKALITGGEA